MSNISVTTTQNVIEVTQTGGITVTTPEGQTIAVTVPNSSVNVTNTTDDITITEVGITNTDQLIEGTTNLFFTNARARAAISLSTDDATVLDYNSSTGVFTWDTPTTTKIAEGTNLYYTTARQNTDFDTRLATKTTTNLAEGTNLYYTTARANTDFDTRLATKTTTNLAEGTNQYFTQARARQSLSAGTGISYDNSTGVITNTSINTDTTYTIDATTATGGANLNLVGSDSSTDTVKFAQGTGITVARTDANTITITNTVPDTNTTYTIASAATSGGANLTLTGSDSSTDSVAYLGAGATTVTSTDANTITITSTDTNTTYTQNASATSGGANLNLVGSDSSTDSVAYLGSGATTITRTDANTITVSSTDTNTTYTQNISSTSGGANLNLVGSDSTTDTVKFANGTGVTVAYTDADTATISIGQSVGTGDSPSFAGITLTTPLPVASGGTGRAVGNYSIYANEIHVGKDGNDTSGDGTLINPVLTITKALTLIGAGRNTVIVHPGSYSESPTVSSANTTIATAELTGANTQIAGTLTLSAAARVSGIKLTNLTITGSGNTYISNCTVDTQVIKSGSNYVEIINSELQCTSGIQITGTGTVSIVGNKCWAVTVSNASANVLIKDCYQVITPTVTAGTLQIDGSAIFASSPISNAVTSSASSFITLANSFVLNSVGTNVERVSLSGFYSIVNLVYDKPNSTLIATSGTGGNLNAIDYFSVVNADTLAGTSGLTLTTLGSNGNLTLAPNGTGDIVTTFSNGGNLTNSRNYVFGAVRNSTTEGLGDIWALNTTGTVQPFRGVTIDNSSDTTKLPGYLARSYSNTAGFRGRLVFERARGTAASPSAVQLGDFLGEVAVTGYSSTGWINDTLTVVPGFFGFSATENWVSNTALGTGFALSLAPTATTITTAANLIPTISSTPQTNYFRADRFAIGQGKTSQFAATGCSTSGTTLTIGTLTSGTIAVGQTLTFTAGSANGVYIVSGSGSTWTISESVGTLTAQGVSGHAGFIAGPTAATSTDVLQNLKLIKNTIQGSGGTTQIVTSSAGATLALAGDTITLESSAGTDYAVLNSTSATFAQPVGLPVKTATQWNAITGAVGQMVCVSDSASGPHPNGMMAFWDTTSARWSYIHDNTAV